MCCCSQNSQEDVAKIRLQLKWIDCLWKEKSQEGSPDFCLLINCSVRLIS